MNIKQFYFYANFLTKRYKFLSWLYESNFFTSRAHHSSEFGRCCSIAWIQNVFSPSRKKEGFYFLIFSFMPSLMDRYDEFIRKWWESWKFAIRHLPEAPNMVAFTRLIWKKVAFLTCWMNPKSPNISLLMQNVGYTTAVISWPIQRFERDNSSVNFIGNYT